MNDLLPTLDDTIGPYFPPCFAVRDRLNLRAPFEGLNASASGTPIRVYVRMIDVFGELAAGCSLIDVWQANALGVMRRPDDAGSDAVDSYFDGFGRVVSMDGSFEIDTIKPGAVVSGNEMRAPHVTLTFFCDGFNRLVTQFFFEDEPLNKSDPLLQALPAELRPRLIAHRIDDVDGNAAYLFQVRFRGAEETPFFDDLLS